MKTTTVQSSLVQSRIAEAIGAIESLTAQTALLTTIGQTVVERLAAGGTLYCCGNGGSASQAMHLAEELIGRYRTDRPPQRAICLNADPTALTCIANDFGYEQVFARQCQALLREGDMLVVFSTSGRSPNIVEALQAAREAGAVTIGLLGKDGGACAGLCDLALIVPGTDSAFIQDAHQVVLHLICEFVERAVNPGA